MNNKLKLAFSWASVRDYGFIFVGSLLQALAIRLFLVPSNLVSGGVSGISQLINYFTGWPIGLMILLGNLPLFALGWKFLGGRRFAMRTAFSVMAISILTDFLVFVLPVNGLTDDILLNTLYGGVVSGLGFGLVYRGQGTSGGSDILARILSHWRGISISQSYLATDAIVMFVAGLVFSWENALYALVMLYVSGIAAEAITQGSDVVRTALVITSRPQEVAHLIMENLERGVTFVTGRGGYTGEERTILYCVISRSEAAQVKAMVRDIDPKAFMVIGHATEVLGEGFHALE